MVAITKGEFARRRGVSPGRVSQWLSERKITGAAIVGEGRSALIDEVLACEQLGLRLDTGQRFGNGLKTNLTPFDPPAEPAAVTVAEPQRAPPASSGAGAPASAPIGERPPDVPDTVERQIQQQKLEQLQRANRQARTNEEIENGRLCDVVETRRAAIKEAQQLIIRVEGSLTEIASDLAAKFKLPARDVLHELRAAWRKTRQGAAIEARERAEPMPERVGHELPETDQAG